MAFCAIDFETYYDENDGDECSVKVLGPDAYVRHPRFKIIGVSLRAGDLHYSGTVEQAPWEKLHGMEFVAHNARFDKTVYEFFLRQSGVTSAPRNPVWRCTADMSVYLRGGRSLKDAAKDLLNLELKKDPRSKAKGKMYIPGSPEFDEYMVYCHSDTSACYALWEKYNLLWPAHEREVSRLNMERGARGVAVDVETLTRNLADLQMAQWEAAKGIPWDWSGKKTPLSHVQVGLWCRKENIPPPASLAEKDEGFLKWEEEQGDRVPWVKALRDWRKTNILLRKLETVRDRTNTDGIMSYETKYFGAHTGRFSGGGGFNIQNLPRKPSYGVDLRGLLIPRPGHKFVIADFAQIEARILLWFAGDDETLKMAREGINIYEAHARATMGWKGGFLKKEDPAKYLFAKIRTLGAGYSAGGRTFRALAAIYGVDLTLEQSNRAVYEYRASNPRVVALWRTMERNFKWAHHAAESFEVGLPSGRSLVYQDITPLGDGLRARTTLGGNLTHFYGGKLVENLVQATARDVFTDRMLALEKAGLPPLFHIHDEYVLEVPESEAEDARQLVIKIAGEAIPWIEGCPIEVEAEVAEQYKK